MPTNEEKVWIISAARRMSEKAPFNPDVEGTFFTICEWIAKQKDSSLALLALKSRMESYGYGGHLKAHLQFVEEDLRLLSLDGRPKPVVEKPAAVKKPKAPSKSRGFLRKKAPVGRKGSAKK